MSGGQWGIGTVDFLTERLYQLTLDPALSRWPRSRDAITGVAIALYSVLWSLDMELSGDTAASNHEEFDLANVQRLLHGVARAAPSAWFGDEAARDGILSAGPVSRVVLEQTSARPSVFREEPPTKDWGEH